MMNDGEGQKGLENAGERSRHRQGLDQQTPYSVAQVFDRPYTPRPMTQTLTGSLPQHVSLEDACLFRSLDTDHDGYVTRNSLEQVLRLNGINPKQSRLTETFELLDALDHHTQNKLDLETFARCIKPNVSLLNRAVRGELVIPDFHLFSREIQHLFDSCAKDEGGANADYIPELRDAPSDRFGLSIVTADHQQLHIGDCDTSFSAQSTTKTINYCLAVEQNGLSAVHRHVGREPSGRVFNELMLNEQGLPHNPMINAGAMMTCSLVHRGLETDERFENIRQTWIDLAAGTEVGFDEAVCRSEAGTAHRNWALAHHMMEKKAFPEGTDLNETLDLYFRTCSLSVTCRQMAMVAGTLASGGVNPITNKRIFSPLAVQACLSLMSSCGMYDYSGEWAFRVGLPAKSGVSGAVIIVVPNVMGICIWSPRLDACGNSVRGVRFAKALVDRFSLHAFDSIDLRNNKINPLISRIQAMSQEKATLIEAANQGDLMAVQYLLSIGADPSSGDYDRRTPLHLAAAGGHLDVVQVLLSKGADPVAMDRWGSTPADDAARGGHTAIAELLGIPTADSTSQPSKTDDARIHDNPVSADLIGFIWAASEGDLTSLRRYIARGVNPDHADYDGRTALHVAASEGQKGAVRFLIGQGVNLSCLDRWGNTPLEDARREGHSSTALLLATQDKHAALAR
jgi:glutaminase